MVEYVHMIAEDIHAVKRQFNHDVANAKNIDDIESLKQKYLGKKGEVTKLLGRMSNVSNEKRDEGVLINELKSGILKKLDEMLREGESKNLKETMLNEAIDITEPMLPLKEAGNIHPISQVKMEIEDWFLRLGFSVLSGPEIESDFFNFEALNIPEAHPARDVQDTFYIQGRDDMVLRTHTSPMQVRAFLKYGAPIRAIVPGRVFRNEATDASHEHTFYQLEGFMVDEEISISHLLGVMQKVIEGVFRREMKIRLRPGHFNFVEPGFEMDMSCIICAGAGCPVCKHSGWVEIVGCGLIHPRVLEYGRIDSKKYSGFAFGFGLTRLAMLRYEIDDMRLILGDDLRFLKQF